jgi:hypothetical protein
MVYDTIYAFKHELRLRVLRARLGNEPY